MIKYKSNRVPVEKAIVDAKKKALVNIGMFVEAESKLRTPVDTGNLRGAITNVADEYATTIGTNVEYAEYVHNGTSRQQAQPFLSDAVEQNIDKITDIAAKELSKIK